MALSALGQRMILIASLVMFLSSFFIPSFAAADRKPLNVVNDAAANLKLTGDETGVPQKDVGTVIGGLIKGALAAVGSIFFILMFYGGLQWMTARGEEDQITKAKDLIKAAMIGLVITIAAYAVTVFVVGGVT